jgi:UDP-N-acetylglucosamine acyltransferase
MNQIHSTAIVAKNAELDDDVFIGPFCHVHPHATIRSGSVLMSHVVVVANTTIGKNNIIHPFTVLGGEAQVKKGPLGREQSVTKPAKHDHGCCTLEIGDNNVFRESVTVNASSNDGDGIPTKIGSNNLFMAGCHIAHDVIVGSRVVVANAVQLAGHVVVEDWVTFGGGAGVAQHLRIGESAFVAAGAMCERDVPPFVIAQGDRARVRALNLVGLERRGVPQASIARLQKVFARIWGARRASFEDGVRSLDQDAAHDPFVAILAHWLRDPIRTTRPSKRPMPR